MPGTNRETLLCKVKDICHIICLTNVSICHIVLPASANGECVSSNVSEFGRKYSYYFCFPGSKFCFCNKSQCFQMWETRNHMGLILFGGGGGEGHSISLPDRFAYTVHIYNFVRDFIRAIFKDFPVGGSIF
jgi:hypothetical protein